MTSPWSRSSGRARADTTSHSSRSHVERATLTEGHLVAERSRRKALGTAELRRLRRRIDALDRRIVALVNEVAPGAREAGQAKADAGGTAVRDAEREREILLRVSMANEGPMPQADLLALYRRLFAATRALGARDRRRGRDVPGDDGRS